MKILVTDRDTLTVQLIRSKLEAMGHTVIEEPVKNNAIERLGKESFDIVFFDPAPLNHARPIVLGIRRSVKNYPYIVMISKEPGKEDLLKSGVNDALIKPLDTQVLEGVAANAERLTALVRRIGDESEDFRSAGGVIAKSALNQLFLAALDRADRYGERSYFVFISIRNYAEILSMDGPYAAEYATAKLSQYLVRLRRQSDVLAQTGKNEYCLMLQRPIYATEPAEAANRFADALGRLEDICASDNTKVEVAVTLLELPSGASPVEHVLTFDKSKKSAVDAQI